MNEMLPDERLLVGSVLDARMLRQKCVSKMERHVPWIVAGGKLAMAAPEAEACRSHSHVGHFAMTSDGMIMIFPLA